MLHLKVATIEDLDEILSMGHEFAAEVEHRDMTFDPQKASDLITSFINSPQSERIIITSTDSTGALTGFIACVATDGWFFKERTSHEVVWYVREKFRKGTGIVRLFDAYEYWAEHVAKCDVIGVSRPVGFITDSFLKRRGYKEIETAYWRKVNGS